MEHILLALTLLTADNANSPYKTSYKGREYVYQTVNAYASRENCERDRNRSAKQNPKIVYICLPRDTE